MGRMAKTRDLAGRAGRTISRSDHDAPDRMPPPANYGKTKIHTHRSTVVINRQQHIDIHLLYSTATQAARPRFCPASHSSDRGPPPHPIKTSFPRGPPRYTQAAVRSTARISWYSGAAPSLVEPANQLLGGRVSPDGNRSTRSRRVTPGCRDPEAFFFPFTPLDCSSLICCDLRIAPK